MADEVALAVVVDLVETVTDGGWVGVAVAEVVADEVAIWFTALRERVVGLLVSTVTAFTVVPVVLTLTTEVAAAARTGRVRTFAAPLAR